MNVSDGEHNMNFFGFLLMHLFEISIILRFLYILQCRVAHALPFQLNGQWYDLFFSKLY